MGDGLHGFGGGFEYEARERRRELLEEAESRRLARLARPGRGLRGRLAPVLRFFAGLSGAVRRRVARDPGVVVGEVPDAVYVLRGASGEAGMTVEVFLGDDGCAVRRIDLSTGADTSSFLTEGRLRR